jgi:anti-sigma regulatory factor (Ser/Thr protein kinase)
MYSIFMSGAIIGRSENGMMGRLSGGLRLVQVTRLFASDLSQLADMRALVADVCVRAWSLAGGHGPLDELILAVQEAATNIIRHALAGAADQRIQLVIDANASSATVTLYHCGREFDPASAQAPAFDGSQEGGFGVYLIEQLVDEVHYFTESTGRSGIRLLKHCGRQEPCS